MYFSDIFQGHESSYPMDILDTKIMKIPLSKFPPKLQYFSKITKLQKLQKYFTKLQYYCVS